MKSSQIKLIVAGVVLVAGWALFRPELLFIDKSVNESFPDVTPASMKQGRGVQGQGDKVLLSGEFHSVAHDTKGMATLHQLTDGKRILRLTGFETSNGPDVRVLLVAAADAADNAAVTNAGFVELGKLKGNIGDQNYEVPADLDLQKYGAVTIWCNRFGVNFGTAALMPGMNDMMNMSAKVLKMGMFRGIAHDTKGSATIHQLPDGRKVLRLTGFETSNGPDVRVLLVAAADAADNAAVTNAGFVEVGKLKGNVGDQNYDLPADLELQKYGAVTIWCNRFGVNFGTASIN